MENRWKIFDTSPSLYGGEKGVILESGTVQTAKWMKWSI